MKREQCEFFMRFNKRCDVKMRPLFTDSLNSLSHFVLGILAFYFPIIIIPFLIYQYILKPDINSTIDTCEFLIGLIFMFILQKTLIPFHR